MLNIFGLVPHSGPSTESPAAGIPALVKAVTPAKVKELISRTARGIAKMAAFLPVQKPNGTLPRR